MFLGHLYILFPVNCVFTYFFPIFLLYSSFSFFFFKRFIYLFIFDCFRLVAARRIFVEACGILPCGAQASLQLWHAGFLSLVVVCGFQSAWALQFAAHRLSSSGARTQQLWRVGLVAPQHVGSQFPDKGLNPHPLHWKADSLPLDHQGSPFFLIIFKNSQNIKLIHVIDVACFPCLLLF